MGTQRRYTLGSRSLTPVECSALVLTQIKRDLEAALDRPVKEAVVTVPAYFGEDQRRATRDACELAGLHVERIINEPTAAALAYGLHNRERELRAVVLDLGGGTFDVTVLEIIEGVVEIQGSAGDARLGGEDFTETLVAVASELLAQQLSIVPERIGPERSRLLEALEGAKQRLSFQERTRVVLNDFAGHTEVVFELTRDQVEDVWTPLIERMRRPIGRALRDARIAAGDVAEVLLVGGATRMPVVANLVREIFQQEPSRELPPDEAVALGAAVQAALKRGSASVEDMVVTDIAPFSLGVATGTQVGTRVVSGLFSPVLERGTVLPASRVEVFWTMARNQSQVEIEVFQGEHSLCKDNTKLGQFTVKGIPRGEAGEQAVEVRFTYDLNGLLEVECTVLATKKKSQLLIEKSSRLSRRQVKEARQKMQALKFHPREALPNVTALARADALYLELTGSARQELGEAIGEFRAALETQDPQIIAATRQALLSVVEQLGLRLG